MSSFKLISPLTHPYINFALISIISFIVFFGSKISVLLLIPIIVYFVIKYRLPVKKFVLLSLSVFVIFFIVNYLVRRDWLIAFNLTQTQALRWCILLFIGLYFDRFISTTSVVYVFYKIHMFNLSIPLLVATRMIPKLKYDIDIGSKAATIRGLKSNTFKQIFIRFNSIVFMILSSTIIFLLEFGTILKIRGIDLSQKKVLNRFKIQLIDYLLILYCSLIILLDKLL